MEILKVLVGVQSHNAQNSCHRPLTRSEDGSYQQDLHMLPDAPGKEHSKSREDRGIFAWQGRPGPYSWWSKTIAYLAFR